MRRLNSLCAVVSLAIGALSCGHTDMPVARGWQLVLDRLPGALLRVWGRSSKDVYAVGADGDGKGPLLLHYDGTKWKRLETGERGDLWWIDAVGEDDLRLVGKDGLILRYSPRTGVFERRAAPARVTLFGAWGSSSSEVWYVGGQVSGGPGVIWRDNGSVVRAPLETTTATRSSAIFKAFGFSRDDVWMVGQNGVSVHWNGSRFEEPRTGTGLPLLTVHGNRKDRFYAVGGVADGILLSWDGSKWTDETPPETPAINGVFAVRDDLVHAAGFNGRIFRRDAAKWSEVKDMIPTYLNFHSVWADETGGIWAAGGQLERDPPTAGVLVHYGSPIAAEISP